MRKEMVAYGNKYPHSRQVLWQAYVVRRRVEFSILRRRVPLMKTGSHSWHLLQEKLSRRSSLGIDLEMRTWFYTATLPVCGPDLCVFPGTIIHYPRNVAFGTNVFVNRGVIITAPAPVSIGSQALIGPYVVINSGNHQYSDPLRHIRDQGHHLAPITIGDDVWIGAHATILAGVTIGAGSVIAAGAVVTNDVDPFTVVAGVPARPISKRGHDER
jgi:acetyltransferase-like isoleucine patch superfamily enzyme